MLIRFALRRITRHWHLLLVPLLGVCLATGLFALAPLYSRAITELGLRYTMEAESNTRVNIRVVDSQPLDETVSRQAVGALGDLFQAKFDVAASSRTGSYTSRGEPRQSGWFLYSYGELDQHATLSAGRWPRDRLPYYVPSVGGLRVDAGPGSEGRLVLRRAAADVEAVATAQVLENAGLNLGGRLYLGPNEDSLIVRIVGVIAANDRTEPFWMGEAQPLDGTWIRLVADDAPIFFGSLFVSRPFMERIVDGIVDEPTLKDDLKVQADEAESQQLYRSWHSRLGHQKLSNDAFDKILAEAQRLGFIRATPLSDVTYSWNIILDRNQVTASTMRETAQNVLRMGEITTSNIPNAQVVTGLVSIIRVYLDQIRTVQAPITFLTSGVLVLVLYYVLTATSLALEQQATEWATISSRGGSTTQLIVIHAITVIVQCSIGLALSLPIAQVLLFLLRRIGPLAHLAVGPTLHIAAPPETWNYAAIAAAVSAIALLLPALPAARRTIIVLQQAVARPPRRPAWARFFLDFVLLGLGLALLWRSGQLGNLQTETFTGVTTLDAMTVMAPLLVLTGSALLWLRLYPILMRFAGRIAARARGLVLPMGFWGISRNPGHYAQLVLLLLGAFGLGAMASTLSATRDSAAWQQAQIDTGGAVRVELNELMDAYQVNWDELPEVVASSPVFRGATNRLQRSDTLQLLGVQVETLAQVTPLDPQIIASLQAENQDLGGIPLPENLSGIALWAYHTVPHADTELTLWAVLSDRWGHPLALQLEGDALTKNEWVRWQAQLPANSGRPPWRLVGLTFTSERGTAGMPQGTVTIDDITATLDDGSLVTVSDMEPGGSNWTPPADSDRLSATTVEIDTARPFSGTQAIGLTYSSLESARYGARPFGVWVDRVQSGFIPVFVERSWADQKRLAVGDPLRVEVTLDAPYDIRGQRIFCEIVGVLDGFPTLGAAPAPFILAPMHQLLPAINAGAADWPLEPNEVWLATEAYEPSAALLDSLDDPRVGAAAVHTAYQKREALRREPLPNAFAGILFGGFWVALLLSLVGLGFYLALTVRRRVVSFGVLRALGWTGREVWQLLVVEQLALTLPAVIVGIGLGIALAGVVRDLIPVVAGARLVVAPGDLAIMCFSLLIGLAVLLAGTGLWLQQRRLARTLRLGGE